MISSNFLSYWCLRKSWFTWMSLLPNKAQIIKGFQVAQGKSGQFQMIF